jgi:hypothetical protein
LEFKFKIIPQFRYIKHTELPVMFPQYTYFRSTCSQYEIYQICIVAIDTVRQVLIALGSYVIDDFMFTFTWYRGV